MRPHEGARLAGTLTVPPGPGPRPAVVLIPGSGPLTRRTPRYMGDLLTAYGIAALTADKRGTGESTGSWNALSHREWAVDVHAQLDWLARQPGIDPSRLGIVAGSEGCSTNRPCPATRPGSTIDSPPGSRPSCADPRRG